MKQFVLPLAAALLAGSAQAFEADFDGTTFNIDTVYCHVVGPGITQSKLALSAEGRAFNVYTSTMTRRADDATSKVNPVVIIGNDQCQYGESVSSMAARHNGKNDVQLLTGINGDFFITSAFANQHEWGTNILGYPNMSCVIDGKLAAPDIIDITSRENALIVTNDNWYIDATDLTYGLASADGSQRLNAFAVNYPRKDDQFIIYNSYMGESTGQTDNGREMVLRMVEGEEWHINQATRFVAVSDWTPGGNTAIPEDGIVLSAGNGFSNPWLESLKKGDEVRLEIGLSLSAHGGITPDVRYVIGGDVRILNQGEITREAIRWINTPSTRYQRSLVGFNKDRDMMIFAAVDGTGLSYYESAAMMKALGCYDALDLDGGGSTAIWSDAFGIYNKPRDGAERAIGDALFFSLSAPSDKTVTSIRFADYVVRLPQYGTYTPVIYGYNQYGQLVDTDVQGFTLSAPEALGTTDGTSLTASGSGMHALTASVGDMTATVAVTVDDSYVPSAVHSSLLIDNYHPAPINLIATSGGNSLPIAASAFQWSSDNEAVATVDENGYVSGHADGSAVITAVNGDVTITVDVMVQCPTAAIVNLLPDFDKSQWTASGSNVTVNSIAVAEQPAFALDFKIKTTRAPKITLRRKITLYSRPDAIRLVLNPGDVAVGSVTLGVAPNGAKAINATRDNIALNTDNELVFEAGDFGDITDPGIFPLTFNSMVINFDAPVGDYTLNISKAEVLYNSFTEGVTDVAIDGNEALQTVVIGNTVAINGAASALALYDLTGRKVAEAANASSIEAPAVGLYILRADNRSCKVIVR